MSDCGDILISVRSEYATKMLSGQKTVELRRRYLNVKPGTRVWIYSKAPHAAVRARAVVESIVSGKPAGLWRKFRCCAGVSRREFCSYFGNIDVGHAILLKNIRKLPEEMSLATIRRRVRSFHPPQFYIRLTLNDARLEILQSVIRG